MSITFSGSREDASSKYGWTSVDDPEQGEDDVGFNLSNGNAYAFLAFLSLPVDDGGSITIPEARRAVIRARATFERKVDTFTREASDTKRPGQCRVISAGIGEDYFARRLDGFAALVERLAAAGATHITWG